MRKNKGTFGFLLMLVFSMVLPIGITLMATAAGSTVDVEITIADIETTQYPTNVVINEILFMFIRATP